MPSLCEANAEFGFRIFRELKQNAEDNLVISPLSISAAMAMVLFGAREKTAFQIQKVLHLDEVTKGGRPGVGDSCGTSAEAVFGIPGEIHSQFHSLLEEIHKPTDDYSLTIANRLYGSQTFPFLQRLSKVWYIYTGNNPENWNGVATIMVEIAINKEELPLLPGSPCLSETHDPVAIEAAWGHVKRAGLGVKGLVAYYLDGLKDIYKAGLETVDFLHASEDSRGKINSWVENRTNGKIKELFPAGTIDPTTVLVLANAIYFKGKWAMKFKQENTREANFRTNKDTSRPVQMMEQTGIFNMGYIEDSQGKILELPYTNKHLSMFVLLPSDNVSLEKLEQDLTFEKLSELINPENMGRKEVILHFPRFRVEETYFMKATLEAMGMTDIFDTESADFSGMTTLKGLTVSKIIHKSYVEVNEEGTEAAAAAGVVFGYNSSRKEEFNCDHPFLFLIRHNKSNSILFYGRVAAP